MKIFEVVKYGCELREKNNPEDLSYLLTQEFI